MIQKSVDFALHNRFLVLCFGILLLILTAGTMFGQRPPRPDDPPPPRRDGPPAGKWWDRPEMVKKLGISPDQHEKIFDIFQRINKKTPGTGIGLAIVKKAAERMGGRVGVQSVPGAGSAFWIASMRWVRPAVPKR